MKYIEKGVRIQFAEIVDFIREEDGVVYYNRHISSIGETSVNSKQFYKWYKILSDTELDRISDEEIKLNIEINQLQLLKNYINAGKI